MRIPHSTDGWTDGEQWRWAPIAALTSSSLVPTRAQVESRTRDFLLCEPAFPPYLERGSAVHLASGNRKSCVREIAVVSSEPIFHIVKTNTSPTGGEIRSYAQLQRQIHDALRVEHPEWVEPNGDCPTCESYESRLAELLGLSSEKKDRQVA
jgi:hypothetical protein